MKKVIFLICMVFMGMGILGFSVSAEAVSEESPELIPGAVSGILLEQSSGTILYQKEMNKRLSPASMTKIMTLLLIYEAMDNHQFDKETVLTTSETAANMGGSQVYLKVGEKITVDEALKCICIASANDCAVLMAEEVSGSEAHFVRRMNERAKELGCKNTNFEDCTGLTSQNHYTSAYDLGLIAKELLNKFPEITEYTTLKEDYIRKDTSSPFWLINTNKMIGRVEGLNGLKTGYTSFSGYCITLSMRKENMDLISVVFGYDKSTTRNTESLELLKYGYSNYKRIKVFSKGDIIESIHPILYKDKINIVVKKDIYYLCKKKEDSSFDYKYEYTLNKDSCEGKIEVYVKENKIAEGELISVEPVRKKNIFELAVSILKNCFV